MKLKTFHIINFGCKLNIYESESMALILKQAGAEEIKDVAEADLVIINTCTVTAKADAKCRYAMRKVRRDNPECCIVLCGCMVDTEKEELTALHEADILIANKQKSGILDALAVYEEEALVEKPFFFDSSEDGTFQFNTVSMSTHARAFIKIQDGCDNFCSYCKIPFARGRNRSRAIDDIIRDIEQIEANGYREVILTGINIGNYCYGEYNFPALLQKILAHSSRLRIRLSSLEPQNIPDEFYSIVQNKRICPHFHIALQSGSNQVLKLMNRHYTTSQYLAIIDKIRAVRPDAFIATDLILGFPGETVGDVAETLATLTQAAFAGIHLFGYSPRKGTKAYHMSHRVPERIRDQRINEVTAHMEPFIDQYMQSMVGRTLSILIEHKKDSFYMGTTENYLDVILNTSTKLTRGEIYTVVITSFNEQKKLIGVLGNELYTKIVIKEQS